MSKYPFVYFLRTSKYSGIDNFIEQNKEKLECTVEIIGENDLDKLNNLFDNSKYHILVTFGDSDKEYIPMIMPRLVDRMRNRWFHRKTIDNLGDFNKNVNCCFVFNAIMNREDVRPKFSIFTTWTGASGEIRLLLPSQYSSSMTSPIMRIFDLVILLIIIIL